MNLDEKKEGLDLGRYKVLTASMSKYDGAIDIEYKDGLYIMTVWVWESIDPQSSPIPNYTIYFSFWGDLMYNVSKLTTENFYGFS